MVNWPLFLLLCLLSVPGIVITVPRTIASLESTMKKRAPPNKIPPVKVIIVVGVVQSFVLVLLAAAVGTVVTPLIGFRAPFLESLVAHKDVWSSLQPQLLPSFVFGLGGGIIFVAAYYRIFRPRLDEETVATMEGLRMKLGLSGRLLYGGIVEEILTRWGLLSSFVWVGSTLSGTTPVVIWISIIGSGVLFGLGHLPTYLGAGCRKTPLFIALAISLNLWASLIFGWLFWKYGLAAAMIAHMLFHVVWYPLDVHFA